MGTKRIWLIIGLLGLVILIGLILAGYWFNWDWTGFTQHIGPQVPQYQPTKTLWDWLQLLIIPVVLAVAALLFNMATSRTEQKIAAKRYEQDQEIALDKQREDLLQTYLDRISELLLEKNLRASQPDSEVRNVARVRTITILFQLDSRRIGYVFSFLRESGLMFFELDDCIIRLDGAEFNKVNWSQANLIATNLSLTKLNEANLSGTRLHNSNLCSTSLYKADLSRADLLEANLVLANLTSAKLSYSNLRGAKLDNANLRGADLSRANLHEASLTTTILRFAYLSEADLTGANLSRADLTGANLSGAIVAEDQLNKVKSLESATMPDGSKHP